MFVHMFWICRTYHREVICDLVLIKESPVHFEYYFLGSVTPKILWICYSMKTSHDDIEEDKDLAQFLNIKSWIVK